MSFLKTFFSLLKNLFSSGSDQRFKGELKQYETYIKNLQPPLYKNGFLTANMAGLFNILYVETKILFNLFTETIAGEDNQKANKYTDMLITTGFFAEHREIWNSLHYDVRKKELEKNGEDSKVYEEQQKRFEKMLHLLNTDEFKRIEKVIRELDTLVDICRFNYVSVLHQFDPSFSTENSSYVPEFRPVLLHDIENTLMDLYYISANLDIKAPEARAVSALAELHNGGILPEEESKKIIQAIKKINAVFRNILTPSTLQKLIFLSKNTTEVHLQTAQYTRKVIQPFKERLKKQFDADTKRMRSEFQDLKIQKDITNLFGAKELIPLRGYNQENNAFFQENSTESFQYITPIQILNTFERVYLSDSILSLLNDIVVEGFFSNPLYKTEFAASVFACTESKNRMQNFERSFDKNEENDIELIKSYIVDGRQNADLLRKMTQMIEQANLQAKTLIETQTNHIHDLTLKISALLSEAKKSISPDITNIKILLTSTRNKDNADLLEKQFPQWKIFLDIMQIYVIISDIEKKNT